MNDAYHVVVKGTSHFNYSDFSLHRHRPATALSNPTRRGGSARHPFDWQLPGSELSQVATSRLSLPIDVGAAATKSLRVTEGWTSEVGRRLREEEQYGRYASVVIRRPCPALNEIIGV